MITWVMGASGVGKRTFIRCMVMENPQRLLRGFSLPPNNYKPYWMEDGEISLSTLVKEGFNSELLVRWQWERDVLLRMICREYPLLTQNIYLIEASLDIRMKRIEERDGKCDWEKLSLAKEAKEVDRLLKGIKLHYNLPIMMLESNQDFMWEFNPRGQPSYADY